MAPIFKVRGICKKEGSTGEKWDFIQKGGLSKNSKQNVFCHKFVKSSVYFEHCYFLIQKIKNIGVIVWQIKNFRSKTQKAWDLWVTE